jgi:hypothetical protein
MTRQIVTWYRTHRWLRWPVDLATVLALVLVVAVAHTVIFNGWDLLVSYRQLQSIQNVEAKWVR